MTDSGLPRENLVKISACNHAMEYIIPSTVTGHLFFSCNREVVMMVPSPGRWRQVTKLRQGSGPPDWACSALPHGTEVKWL